MGRFTLELDDIARHLKMLDREFKVQFSEYTGGWYATGHIEIGDGFILAGVTEHRDTPETAIRDYFLTLCRVAEPRYLVTNSLTDERKQWRWNGVCFARLTVAEIRVAAEARS